MTGQILTGDIQDCKIDLQCFRMLDRNVKYFLIIQEIRSDLFLAITVYIPDANFH